MEAPTIGIGRLLKEGGRFLVPHHQRDFSWTEDEIEQLFKDIEDARSSSQSEYFIGLMVFMTKNDREFTILDGQQRLATTIIFLAAVRSWLRARDFNEDADHIQSNYIAVRELGRQELDPRLILNENNNAFFKKHIVKESPIEEIRRDLEQVKRYDPNRRLLEAALFCREYVSGVAGSSVDVVVSAEKLYELVRFIENNVKIVRLNVSTEADAYTVFETLNDRGLDLSVLDLVKNYLFSKAGGTVPLRDIQSRWSQMMANLTSVRADDFLKAWWTSRNGRIQTAQLFTRFKEKISKSALADETSNDMVSASEQYAALDVADDPLWARYSTKARDHIRSLKLLGGLQIYPVLLSALEKYGESEMERLLRLLEVLIVRYQLIGGGRTGRLEVNCARVAHRIFIGECRTASQAGELLKDVLPNDSEFKEAFNTKQEKNSQKARFILSKLENQLRLTRLSPTAARELEPSISLTLEHIFPKSPNEDWAEIVYTDSTFAEDCTYRLGNLCLLTNVNRSLGNKSFNEKKTTYEQSDLFLTKDLATHDNWDRENVERRQSEMSDLALAYWRFN